MLTDDACERLISGRLAEDEAALAPVVWFLEDLKSLYIRPIPRAVESLHPSATSRPAQMFPLPGRKTRACKPERSWWTT